MAKSLRLTNVLTASLTSSALFSGLVLIDINFFEADTKSAIIFGTFCAIVTTCILVAHDDDRTY